MPISTSSLTATCAALAVGLAVAISPAHAEVKKFLQTCSGGGQTLQLCPNYQIVLTAPEGWQIDRQASNENKVQVVVPNGRNFGNAPALIYVKISLRQNKQSLEDFIRVSHERWKQSVPDAKIQRLDETPRTNGKAPFISYRFDNPSAPQQAAEIVSYGFDSDTDGNEFVLMAVMTGRDKKALDQADKPYKALLRAH